jgi:hypothetical protein
MSDCHVSTIDSRKAPYNIQTGLNPWQQTRDMAWWRDIAIEQYRRKISNPNGGNISFANS